MYKIEKELPAISWLVTEPEYRADPALSYSTLARFEREGFNNLSHLFDKVESPSLLFGSVVDTLVTGGEEEFNRTFTVVDLNVTDSGMQICKALVDKVHQGLLPYKDFQSIPEETVSQVAKETGFWKADKWDKIRYREVLKTGNVPEVFQALISNEKRVISTDLLLEAQACVRALKESSSTHAYFAANDPFSPFRRYYQLKFKARLKGVDYRCMADLITVDYEKKIIQPVDLKTSSHTEWDFQESFCQWSYMIQARLYWLIIKTNLINDPYFKDFSLENYKFIVVNRKTLTPLVWEFPLTTASGTLIDDRGKEYRDPLEIGAELRNYLDNMPRVPKGIDMDGVNTITCLHKKTNV